MERPSQVRFAWSVIADVARSRAALIGAAVLLPYAGVLVGMDVAARYGDLTDARLPDQLFLSTEGGFGEWYEYAMTMAASVLLFLLWWAEADIAYLANSVLFGYLTLDNSLQIHEEGGDLLAPLLTGLDWVPVAPDQIGEMIFLVLVGAVWGITLAMCLWHGRLRPLVHSLLLAACIAATAVFGVLADFLDSWGRHSLLQSEIGNFIEDGGEFGMIVVCLLMTIAIYDSEKRRRAMEGGPAD